MNALLECAMTDGRWRW